MFHYSIDKERCCCLPPLEAALRRLAAPVLALVNLVLFVVAVSAIDDQLCKFLPSFSSAFCMPICEPGAPCCYELHCCTKSQVCISTLALPVHSFCMQICESGAPCFLP